MSRSGREAPLPDEMQGQWVDSEDPSFVVEISGGKLLTVGIDPSTTTRMSLIEMALSMLNSASMTRLGKTISPEDR